MFAAHVIDWQGKMLGRYRLVRLLGRGGMGEVWQAQDTELARQVAIKLLPPVLRHEEEYLRTFTHEARTIASLEHPHILAVHDFGEFQSGDEVITYLVMPLVNTTLRTRIKQQDHTPLPMTTSLGYLRQAAQAIDYAHSKRILHRDIKPANMLLQDDWLFLSDFGLAKLLSTSTYRSRTHAGAGTPGYMAPEQIRGRALPASDLYSLAIVAYQLLTGHLPFSGDEPYAIFLKHILHDPPSPRQFNARLPEAVEYALLRSLSRQPEERHPSCQTFVAELEQGWQGDMTNSTQPDTTGSFDTDTTLLASWNKRAVARLITQRNGSTPDSYPLTPPSSVAQNGSTISQYSTPHTLPDQSGGLESRNEEGFSTETGSGREKTASERSRRSFLLGGAATALLVAGGGIALSSLYHPPINMPPKLSAGIPMLKLTGHSNSVNNIRWNPRGRYLISGGEDARLLLWDVETLLASSNGKLQSVEQPAASYEPDEGLSTHDLDWSPDGRSLAVRTSKTAWSGYRDAMKTIDIFSPGARSTLYYDAAVNGNGNEITVLAWSPQGNTIATSINNDIEVVLWKVGQTNRVTTTLKDPTRTALQKLQEDLFLASLCWSQDGIWLAGIDPQFSLALWNTATNTMQRMALPDRTKYLHIPAAARGQLVIYNYTVVASPTTPTLFAASDNDVIALYDVQKRTFTRLLSTDDPTALQTLPSGGQRPYYAQITALAWSPDGRYLAGSYYSNNSIYLWDLQNTRPRLKNGAQMPALTFGKSGHTSAITDLTWSPNERYLASSSLDSTIIIWKMDGS